MSDLAQTLLALEQRLLDPSIRAEREAVNLLLSDDFLEFGSSGRIYDKATTIAELQEDPGFDGPRTIQAFDARTLSPEIAHVTYRIRETGTLRSSIWRHEVNRWRMLFHQGTKSKPTVG